VRHPSEDWGGGSGWRMRRSIPGDGYRW
jgi:hypothetical protein